MIGLPVIKFLHLAHAVRGAILCPIRRRGRRRGARHVRPAMYSDRLPGFSVLSSFKKSRPVREAALE